MTAPRASTLATLGILSLLLAAPGCRRGAPPATRASGEVRYHCPMHPTYVSDKPGDCPICGMKLVPGGRKLAYYRSPMDPSVRSDRPAKDAMGMDFVPVYDDELLGGPTGLAAARRMQNTIGSSAISHAFSPGAVAPPSQSSL